MSSVYSSKRNNEYESMVDLVGNDGDRIQHEKRQAFCSKYAIGFFILGLFCGAAVLLLSLHIMTGDAKRVPSLPKNSSDTGLGCSSFSDIKILVNQASKIIPHQTTCGHQALGNVYKFEKCFEAATHLSPECSACYGGLTQCGKNKCLAECLLGPSQKCSECVCANCRRDFRTCLKIPCTIIPAA